MDTQHQILVVSPSPTRCRDLRTWLSTAGYWVTVVSGFQAAKVQLQSGPAALITDLKLAEYNGLHLAVRAIAAQIPVLILSEPDLGIDGEADKLGAACLATADVSRERTLEFVESKVPPAESTSHTTPLIATLPGRHLMH